MEGRSLDRRKTAGAHGYRAIVDKSDIMLSPSPLVRQRTVRASLAHIWLKLEGRSSVANIFGPVGCMHHLRSNYQNGRAFSSPATCSLSCPNNTMRLASNVQLVCLNCGWGKLLALGALAVTSRGRRSALGPAGEEGEGAASRAHLALGQELLW